MTPWICVGTWRTDAMTTDRPVRDQVAVFERHTDHYDAWFDAHPAAYRSQLQAVRESLPSDWRIALEIGIGTGRGSGGFVVARGIRRET